MTKFLKLVENNLPSEEDMNLSVMVDKLAELLDTLDSVTVVSTAPARELTITINGHIIVLEVKDAYSEQTEKIAEEVSASVDMAAKYNIDSEVDRMASQAGSGTIFGMGTAAMKAKSAKKRRDDVVGKAIPIYDNITKQLEGALKNAKVNSYLQIRQ